MDAQVYSHMFTANGETYNVQSTDVPLNDPLTITLNKVSADGTVVANPASLEGAEFTIKYYAGQYTFNDLPTACLLYTSNIVIYILKKCSYYLSGG